MKKTTVFTLAAVCGAFVLALPDWKQPLNAAYPKAKYKLVNAELTQSLSVNGCKKLTIKKTKKNPSSTLSSLTLYDNNSYSLYRYSTGGTDGVPATIMSGSWSEVLGKKGSKTIYLSTNTATLGDLFTELEGAGVGNGCQFDVKEPAAKTTKNTVAIKVKKVKGEDGVKAKKSLATSVMKIAGIQENAGKLGKFSLTASLKGGIWCSTAAVPGDPDYNSAEICKPDL